MCAVSWEAYISPFLWASWFESSQLATEQPPDTVYNLKES